MYCLFCFYILFVCKCVLPPGDNPIAVNKYIISILVLFIYTTRLASIEIFSPSNKIHRKVGRAKDLSAPLYAAVIRNVTPCSFFFQANFWSKRWRQRFSHKFYYPFTKLRGVTSQKTTSRLSWPLHGFLYTVNHAVGWETHLACESLHALPSHTFLHSMLLLHSYACMNYINVLF